METEVLKELNFKKIQDNLWVYIGDLYIITCSSLRHKDVSDMKLFFRESEKVVIRSAMSGDKDSLYTLVYYIAPDNTT